METGIAEIEEKYQLSPLLWLWSFADNLFTVNLA